MPRREDDDEALPFVWDFMPPAPPEKDEDMEEEQSKEEATEVSRHAVAGKEVDEEERRVQKEYYGHGLNSPDYDKLVRNGDVEAYFRYLPKWIRSQTHVFHLRCSFSSRELPSDVLDPGYLDLVRRFGHTVNETIARETELRIELDINYPIQVLEHLLPPLSNVTKLSLGRPSNDGRYRSRGFRRRPQQNYRDTEEMFLRLATIIQGLRSLEKLCWDLPANDMEVGDFVCQEILKLSALRELTIGGSMPSSAQIFQALIEKESLCTLCTKQNLPTKEHLMAMVYGLQSRKEPLEYENVKFDPELVSFSLDGVLKELKFILETSQVQPVSISVGKDVCCMSLKKQCSNIRDHAQNEGNVVCAQQQQARQQNRSSDFLQALVQKESLSCLSISYGIDDENLLNAIANGLQHRQSSIPPVGHLLLPAKFWTGQYGPQLDHLSLTVDRTLAMSSMDAFLLDLGFIIATKKVETVTISVSNGDRNQNQNNRRRGARSQQHVTADLHILHMPLSYSCGGRIPTLWVQPAFNGVALMPSWREWFPYMCFSLGLRTIEILGVDGCPAGCDVAAGIASAIPIHDLQINLTEDYPSSTAFMDLSHATRHLKRIGILKQEPDKGEFNCGCCGPTRIRIPIHLKGEIRFSFPSTLQELIFGRGYGHKSITVSMEYITEALSSFPNRDNFDNPSQLQKVKAFLPEKYFETTDVAVRKTLYRSYLDAAWKHCHLSDLAVEGQKVTGQRSYSRGAVHNLEREECKHFCDEVKCMLGLNEAGRSYLHNPNGNHWWSGVCTLASLQKLPCFPPDLRPSAIYYLLQEDPPLLDPSLRKSCEQKPDDWSHPHPFGASGKLRLATIARAESSSDSNSFYSNGTGTLVHKYDETESG